MADNVANNLANINTNGFKQTLLQIQAAPSMNIFRIQTDPGQTSTSPLPGVPVAQYVGTLGTGSQVYDTPNNFSEGSLKPTGNPLDLAISGNQAAFFTVQTPNGVRYTRDGQFVQNANGVLQTQDGYDVLSTTGQQIQLQNTGPVTIATDGTISQNGVAVGQLALTQFTNLVNLRPEGDNNFAMSGNAGPGPATGASIQQGFLESSNGNVVKSMVDLITAERWFDMNEKSIKTQDDATNTAIQQIAKTA